jgi:hypothetical protein
MRSDGSLLWFPAVGEYRFTVSLLPIGYSVKSLTYGSMNLRETTLKITELLASPAEQLHLVLTTSPLLGDPVGVKVSGRVMGLDTSGTSGEYWLRLINTIASGNPPDVPSIRRVGQTRINTDGTFELLHVPPGMYSLGVTPTAAPGLTSNVTVVVGDVDVIDVQLVAGSRALTRSPANVTPAPLSPPASRTLP